ncbi:hypothetical protein CAEBREN_29627 [Caenorhabditis brenneri]|uniref:Uncharacterized protein n=1 Tax=Caenorhabditis brenneri TaxID=135651 RepID=G0N0V8_CAEBE|nr:hypothetical protein CAEBREN_29627 [Caenorhabditis brenneri]
MSTLSLNSAHLFPVCEITVSFFL